MTSSDSSTHTHSFHRTGELLSRSLIYLYALTLFSYVTADPDLWGHIRFGALTLSEGGPVATDPFSYTAIGNTWINHEWLTEVLFFLLYRWGDSTALLVFKSLLGLVIVHLMSSLYWAKSRNPFGYFLFFLLAVPVMAPGFMMRPQLMTFLFLAFLMYTLHRFFDGNLKALNFAPLIFLAWVNCHGGVVAGLGIFIMVVMVEGTLALYRRHPEWRPLTVCGVLSGLAVLINPYGPDLWVFFLRSLGSKRNITEWAPVPLFDFSFIQIKLLALLFFITWFLPTRKRPWEMLMIIISLLFAFKQQRHTVLAAIVMAPYLPLQLSYIIERWKNKPSPELATSPARTFLFTGCAVLLLAGTFNLIDKHRVDGYSIRVEPNVYPTYLGQFMEANRIDGFIRVPFDWGEYFIWKRPASRVSIDGRFRTVYPERIIQEDQAFVLGKAGWEKWLNDLPTRLVITSPHEAAHVNMERMPGWTKIYQDPISKLFVRSSDSYAQQFRKGHLVQPQDPPPYAFPG